MSAETAAVLDEAANVIRRNGWHQGEYFRAEEGKKPENCPVDITGAINIALHTGHPARGEGRRNRLGTWEVAAIVNNHLDVVDVSEWNDEPDRTAEEVIAALESAARAERETP